MSAASSTSSSIKKDRAIPLEPLQCDSQQSREDYLELVRYEEGFHGPPDGSIDLAFCKRSHSRFLTSNYRWNLFLFPTSMVIGRILR